VSRLWPDRLCVSLEPDSVAICHFRGKKLLSKNFVETDSPIQALKENLKNEYLKVTVVLSNRLVRYAIVPFDAAVSTAEEEQALARFHFMRIYGERAKGWALRLSEAPAGRPRLASAIDPEVLEALRGCFPASARPRLASVQPWLMAAYNQAMTARKTWSPSAEPAWLVLLERNRACLALPSAGGWRSVQSLRMESEEEIFALLERETLRAGDGAPRRAMVLGGRPAAAEGWQVAYSSLEQRYAMALSAGAAA
jgi:hypothetical protein